jgi:hypothetical protein
MLTTETHHIDPKWKRFQNRRRPLRPQQSLAGCRARRGVSVGRVRHALVAQAAMSGRFKPARRPRSKAKEFRRIALDGLGGSRANPPPTGRARPTARFGRRGVERRRGERRT